MYNDLYFCFVGLALGIGVCFAAVILELESIKDLIKAYMSLLPDDPQEVENDD